MAGASQDPKVFSDYDGFVERFKPKKTTDDCYTPPEVYNAIRDWACAEYGIDPSRIVRPFYPGGDYERFEYPEGCVVLDNPPFSCLAAIRRFYQLLGIDYFLFAPALTMLCSRKDDCCIAAGIQIIYDNGANVNTGFVTNMDTCILRSAPDLHRAAKDAQKRASFDKAKTLPSYDYPDAVATAAMCNRYSRHGVDFRIGPRDAIRISALDEQRECKKAIFGGGLLLSKRAAAERAAAERAAAKVWHLSDRERQLQKALG